MDIQIDNLSHTYATESLKPRKVLDVAHWRAARGEQVLLRGISGSGKTTFMNIIAGLLPPTQGLVTLNQAQIYALPEVERDRLRARSIGYVFQIHLLVASLSALENVEMPLVFAGERSAGVRRDRAAEALGEVGLGDFLRHKPSQMSAGQRLRVAVARALVNEPDLLLADEPTAALDGATADAVMDRIQSSCHDRQATLLVSSHDPLLNDRFERIIDLQGGRLVSEEGA
jgi:putative ABC transport system ATP-binding protein